MEKVKINERLDAMEERLKAIEVIKDRILYLEHEIYYREAWYQDMRGEDLKKAMNEVAEFRDEIILRIQDLDNFLYDYKETWDLNFDDYEKES